MWHMSKYGGRNHVCNIWWLSVTGCEFGKKVNLPAPIDFEVSPLQHWSHYRVTVWRNVVVHGTRPAVRHCGSSKTRASVSERKRKIRRPCSINVCSCYCRCNPGCRLVNVDCDDTSKDARKSRSPDGNSTNYSGRWRRVELWTAWLDASDTRPPWQN